MAAMRAAAELADHAGDVAFRDECSAALASAQGGFDALQWNETAGHYNAGSSGCSASGCSVGVGLFADSFYGQVLAYSLWGEPLVRNVTKLQSHLQQEEATNCVHTDVRGGNGTYELVDGCPNGLIIMTKRPVEETDLQIWEMATHDHSALLLHQIEGANASAVANALKISAATGTSYSQRLNDQWNVAGIKSNDGYPSITSHYGYHMTAWHIPLALSRQQASRGGANSSLTFSPRLPCPYTLPVFLPGVLGTLSCANNAANENIERAVLEITAGDAIELDHLAVSGNAYPHLPVKLQVGSPISWQIS